MCFLSAKKDENVLRCPRKQQGKVVRSADSSATELWVEPQLGHLLCHSIVVRSQPSNSTFLSPFSLITNTGLILASPPRVTMRIRRDAPCK